MIKDKEIVSYMELLVSRNMIDKFKVLQDKEREAYLLLNKLDERLHMEIENAFMDALELTRHCYLELGAIKSEVEETNPDYDVFKRCKNNNEGVI